MNVASPRIQLLLTGDELMSGDTVDSNSALLARELSVHGLRPARRGTHGVDRRARVTGLAARRRAGDA
ncbi:MAG: hypothetical protein AAF640_13190, partial [Pseudomonadota bacterium]